MGVHTTMLKASRDKKWFELSFEGCLGWCSAEWLGHDAIIISRYV